MSDDKRLIRRLKRGVKKIGNRKRRKHLKDLESDPRGFEFRWDSSKIWNEKKNDDFSSCNKNVDD